VRAAPLFELVHGLAAEEYHGCNSATNTNFRNQRNIEIMRGKILLLFLPFLAGAVFADQVHLKNGDQITGKIQKKDGASLTFTSDIFGPVTIPWESITRVTSDETLTVVLPDGKSVQGKITAENQTLEVVAPSSRATMAMSQVGAIRNADEQKAWEKVQNPGLLSLWNGFADLGISFTRGNSLASTVATGMNATRPTRTDKTSVYFNQIYSKGRLADGTTAATSKAIRGGWAYNRNLGPRLFANFFNDYEYDAFQSLDLRFVLGGGLGYSLVKRETTQLDLLGGGDYSHEKFNTPLTRNSAEIYWGNNLMHKFSKSTSMHQSFRMFNNLSDTGAYRMNFDIGAATVLKKWLSWQLTFSDRYLSDPAPGNKKNDVLFTTGLRFTFAQ
jgi:putative salt-induced outer membrane protein YdiY